ncbi:MAG: hypothetical protein ACAH11_06605 [Sphingomonas sp.]
MRPALILAALLLGAAPPPDDPIGIESPEPDKYQVTLAVISVEKGVEEGYYIPDAEPDDIVIGGDPILIQPARLVRRIAGPPMPDFHKVRRLAGGYRIGYDRAIPRLLAILEHTDQGYYYVQWSQRLTGRFGCFPREVREHFKMRFPPNLKPNAGGAICIDV